MQSKNSFRPHLLHSVLFLVFLPFVSPPGIAQTCGDRYIVQAGDSLSQIAGAAYGDPQKWTVIYNVNLDVVGANPNLIDIGQNLSIPCLGAEAEETLSNLSVPDTDEPSADAAALEIPVLSADDTSQQGSVDASVQEVDVIRFLTGNDYPPFTDQSLPDGGMITDIVVSAMRTNSAGAQFEINWEDDWSLHLNELLSSFEYDMGFPWFRPDCETTPEEFRCENYEFSSPVFEMLIFLFTHKDRPLVFNSDEDIKGAVLCRPKGYFTHDLEKDGRLWLTNNVIELKQPDTITDCFNLLAEGSIDAVAINEFSGRNTIADLQLEDEVVALENKPLSVEGLRVVIHKNHPRSRELLRLFDDSLTDLQLSDAYRAIVAKHFRHYWNTVD